jgi:peptide/nickel transport system substrate-binding protein
MELVSRFMLLVVRVPVNFNPITQAGWVDGTEVAYAYYPGFHGEDVGPILQAQLEQIGVKLKIEEQGISAFNGVFYGDQPPAQRPDMFWYAWWPNLDDPYDWSWILYHSTAAGAHWPVHDR